MKYPIIRLPVSGPLDQMAAGDLRTFCDWFVNEIPSRFGMMADHVRAMPGLEHWTADFSAQSLRGLGIWLAERVETRPRTDAEMARLRQQTRVARDIVPPIELTERTLSMCFDVARYFAEILLRKHGTALRWLQPLGDRRNAHYGYPVITGFGGVPLNPIMTLTSVAYSIARGVKNTERLGEVLAYWDARVGVSHGRAKVLPRKSRHRDRGGGGSDSAE